MMRRRHHSPREDDPSKAIDPSVSGTNELNRQDGLQPTSYYVWRIFLCAVVSIAILMTIQISRQQEQTENADHIMDARKKGNVRQRRRGAHKRPSRHHHDEIAHGAGNDAADGAVKQHEKRFNHNSYQEESKKMRSVPGFFSIFDNCMDPLAHGHEKTTSKEYDCAYFRPGSFFQEGQPGYSFRDVISKEYPDATFASFSWQVNAWTDERSQLIGPLMKLPSTATLLRHIKSVTGFATPKAGSRTQWQLFLDHLTPPKKQLQRDRRVGEVTKDHVEQLYKRQEARAGRKRSDIVFAVIRDPVSRFLSSVAQLLSMRHTRRCFGCDEHLEPCLQKPSNNDTVSSQKVLQCVIQSVQDHGFWNEHIVPSAVFLARPLDGIDLEMAVFPIEKLGVLVRGLGVREEIQVNQRDTKAMDQDVEALANDLKLALTNKVVNDAMIRDICELYAVDVAIQRHLGIPSKYCDGIQKAE